MAVLKARVSEVFGSGAPNAKTQGLLKSRQFTDQTGFSELDTVSITQSHFKNYIERTGLLEYESVFAENNYNPYAERAIRARQKLKPTLLAERLTQSEMEPLLQGFNLIYKIDKAARKNIFVRPDEPWHCGGLGLGDSGSSSKDDLEKT